MSGREGTLTRSFEFTRKRDSRLARLPLHTSVTPLRQACRPTIARRLPWEPVNANVNFAAVASVMTSLAQLKSKLPKATQSEKLEIVRKLREMSPGAERLISSGSWSKQAAKQCGATLRVAVTSRRLVPH